MQMRPMTSQKGFCTCRAHIFTASTTYGQLVMSLYFALAFSPANMPGKEMSSLGSKRKNISFLFFEK